MELKIQVHINCSFFLSIYSLALKPPLCQSKGCHFLEVNMLTHLLSSPLSPGSHNFQEVTCCSSQLSWEGHHGPASRTPPPHLSCSKAPAYLSGALRESEDHRHSSFLAATSVPLQPSPTICIFPLRETDCLLQELQVRKGCWTMSWSLICFLRRGTVFTHPRPQFPQTGYGNTSSSCSLLLEFSPPFARDGVCLIRFSHSTVKHITLMFWVLWELPLDIEIQNLELKNYFLKHQLLGRNALLSRPISLLRTEREFWFATQSHKFDSDLSKFFCAHPLQGQQASAPKLILMVEICRKWRSTKKKKCTRYYFKKN